jgi:hypothetical protein
MSLNMHVCHLHSSNHNEYGSRRRLIRQLGEDVLFYSHISTMKALVILL